MLFTFPGRCFTALFKEFFLSCFGPVYVDPGGILIEATPPNPIAPQAPAGGAGKEAMAPDVNILEATAAVAVTASSCFFNALEAALSCSPSCCVNIAAVISSGKLLVPAGAGGGAPSPSITLNSSFVKGSVE